MISIIMGTLNSSKRINNAIESIVKQTYKDWEFIICNDGSSDDTQEVLNEWRKKDERIVIIENKENKGLAYSLNRCIEIAKGEYIARMDDDDFSYDNRFEIEINFLENNKEYDFVSSSIDVFDGEKILHTQYCKSNKPTKEDFLWGNPFVHPATIFRASSLKKVGGYQSNKLTRRAEDFDLFVRMYAQNMKGYNIQEPLLRYYVSKEALNKRKYKYRIDEAKLRAKSYKMLGLYPKGIIYVLKPLIVGLIPKTFILNLQKRVYK